MMDKFKWYEDIENKSKLILNGKIFGNFIEAFPTDNKDGTFGISFKYDGYYDKDHIFHNQPCYLILPHCKLEPEFTIDYEGNMDMVGMGLEITKRIKTITDHHNSKDDRIFEIIIPDELE